MTKNFECIKNEFLCQFNLTVFGDRSLRRDQSVRLNAVCSRVKRRAFQTDEEVEHVDEISNKEFCHFSEFQQGSRKASFLSDYDTGIGEKFIYVVGCDKLKSLLLFQQLQAVPPRSAHRNQSAARRLKQMAVLQTTCRWANLNH